MNAVIGFPLSHSLSPILHNEIYGLSGIKDELIKCEFQDIDYLVDKIRKEPFGLTAVTIPFKQIIIPYLDQVDDLATKIGAVNTVINRSGKLFGYNTDIYGIEYALRDVEIANRNVLIIGAGGVARPAAYHVNQVGGQVLFYNRTKANAEILAKEFGGKVIGLEELVSSDIDVIINTTSLGMYPDIKKTPLDPQLLSSSQSVFDVVYNPIKTQLLIDAQKCGAKTVSGLDMFIAQGVKQIELWQENKIDLEKYFGQLKDMLTREVNKNI